MLFLVLIGTGAEVYLTAKGAALSLAFNAFWTICFALSVAGWVDSDRKEKAFSAPFEHQAFVFFFWPVVLPCYLFETRGAKGLWLGIGVFVFSCIPVLAALMTYLLVGESA